MPDPDSPMSESRYFRWARLSRRHELCTPCGALHTCHCSFFDFPVLSPLVPLLLLCWVVNFWRDFRNTHSHQGASEELHAHLHLVTPGTAWAVKVKFREGPVSREQSTHRDVQCLQGASSLRRLFQRVSTRKGNCSLEQ